MTADPPYLIYGAMVGLVMGSLAGRKPMSVATENGRSGAGLIAMCVCIVTGIMCGGIGAFPMSWFLTAWIRGLGPAELATGSYAGGYAGPSNHSVGRAFRNAPVGPTDSPFTVIGPVIVCNRCRHSGSRGADGNPPAECPACKQRFTSGAKQSASATRRSRRSEVARDDEDLVELRLARPDRR